MQVKVAGYNIDSSLIARLDSEVATPEVLSAAYARISRSKKSVEELRFEALEHIAKARNSNEKIIFEMGHASVAEHAVFNLDLIGISRHLTELVQRSRLASFTEKSQRYVTFEKDYLVPAELKKDTELSDGYTELCDALFKEYSQSTELLTEHLAKCNPELDKRTLLTLAKEDARYILPLATKTQMGMTINCRSPPQPKPLTRSQAALRAHLYSSKRDRTFTLALHGCYQGLLLSSRAGLCTQHHFAR